MIYLPYKPDFIFRRKNTAILLVQNSKKHCIAWFLTTFFTDLNLKHQEAYKLKFSWVGSFWNFPKGKSVNLAGNFQLPDLVSTSGTLGYTSMVKRRKRNFTGHFQGKLL